MKVIKEKQFVWLAKILKTACLCVSQCPVCISVIQLSATTIPWPGVYSVVVTMLSHSELGRGSITSSQPRRHSSRAEQQQPGYTRLGARGSSSEHAAVTWGNTGLLQCCSVARSHCSAPTHAGSAADCRYTAVSLRVFAHMKRGESSETSLDCECCVLSGEWWWPGCGGI